MRQDRVITHACHRLLAGLFAVASSFRKNNWSPEVLLYMRVPLIPNKEPPLSDFHTPSLHFPLPILSSHLPCNSHFNMSLYNTLQAEAIDQAEIWENIKRGRNDSAIALALSLNMVDEGEAGGASSRSRSRSRSRDRASRGGGDRRSSSLDPSVGVDRECSICLNKMKRSEKRCLVACPQEHVFHDACIKKWLRLKGTCPVCRGSVQGTTVVGP